MAKYDYLAYTMIIAGYKVIKDFGIKHPKSKAPLEAWVDVIESKNYKGFNDLRSTFGPKLDYIYSKYYVFNIGGNKFRLIATIVFEANIIVVKQVWTHAQYDNKNNNKALRDLKL